MFKWVRLYIAVLHSLRQAIGGGTLTSGTAKPFRVIQVTDTHLCEPENGTLLGMDTTNSFNTVLDLIRKEQEQIDLILVTGDLSQDGSTASYERLEQILSEFDVPYYCLPGNHDENDVMAAALPAKRLEKRIEMGEWQIIMLDSSVSKKVYGFLEDKELQFLKESLDASPGLNTLVALHHHPVDMKSRWIDTIGVRNAERLIEVVRENQSLKNHSSKKQSPIRCLLWGHVHQSLDDTRFGVRLLSTPSTCVQFAPGSPDFKVDTASPGYRWLDLYPDGSIESGVSRVEGIDFKIDYSVKGY